VYCVQLYEVYAKQSAQQVHAILKKHRASYIILEDSICLQPPSPDGCGLTNILDAEVSVGLLRKQIDVIFHL
jgi:hypothetical protein